MKITSVNVRKIEKEGSRMKGIASVLLDDSFAVHDIRIIEGDNGLFIAMPSHIQLIQKLEQCFKIRLLKLIITLKMKILKKISSSFFVCCISFSR